MWSEQLQGRARSSGFLLHGGVWGPPVQGRLGLEAVVLGVHLCPGLGHLLQTLPGKERRHTVSQAWGNSTGTAREGWQQLRAGTLAPGLRADPVTGRGMGHGVTPPAAPGSAPKPLPVTSALMLHRAQQLLLLSEIWGASW